MLEGDIYQITTSSSEPLAGKKAFEHSDSAKKTTSSCEAESRVSSSVKYLLPLEMMSALAYEISQPLLSISANATASLRWLQRESVNLENVIEGLKDVRADAERVANLVKALQALAKLGPVRLTPLRLNDVISEAITIANSTLLPRGVRLQISLSADVSIMGDSAQLHYVMLNLINGAMFAMSDRDPGVALLRISSSLTAEGVQVTLDDNAGTLSLAERQRVLAMTRVSDQLGSGLGLPICRIVIEAHGGIIAAEAQGEDGVRIRILLPTLNSHT